MTKINISPPWPEVKPQGFYVYIHRRATDGSVFYVGKGKGKRGWANNSGRSQYWRNTFSKHGCRIEILKDNMDELDAFNLEIKTIKKMKEDGERLVNKTDGGEGPSGAVSSRRRRVYSSLGEIFESLTLAEKYLRESGFKTATSSNISSACLGVHEFVYGRAWSYYKAPAHPATTSKEAVNGDRVRKTMSKGIYRSDGKFFKSCQDAIEDLRKNGIKNPSQGSISRQAMNGGVGYGFRWSYDGVPDHDGIDGKQSRILQTVKPVETECGMHYDSMKSAVDWLRINGYPSATYHPISKCVSGITMSAYGYKWKAKERKMNA